MTVPLLAMGAIYGFAHGFLHGAYIPFALALFVAGPLLWFHSLFQHRAAESRAATSGSRLLLSETDAKSGAACRGCGAPLFFPPPAIAVVMCSYCGSEHLLLRRARRARTVTVARALTSYTTLLDATAALQGRIEARWNRLVQGCWIVVGSAAVLGLLAALVGLSM